MRLRQISVLFILLGAALVLGVADGQSAANVIGKWTGTLSGGNAPRQRGSRVLMSLPDLPMLLDIAVADNGTLEGTLTRTDQGTVMPIRSVVIDGDTVQFSVPDMRGSFTGKLTGGGDTLRGTFTRGETGQEWRLEFEKGVP